MKKSPRQNNISGVLTVHEKECNGNPERMVRKFIKKVKKEGIIDEVRERRYYKKGSVLNAERKRNKKRLVEKINNKRLELFTTTNSRTKRRK